jgi:hypothetical protein
LIQVSEPENPARHFPILPHLAEKYARNGYNFVPLVTKDWGVHCSVDILILRPDLPGTVIKSGDLDNRLKTIFDALRIPQSKDEFGKYVSPDADEKPFYCLLQDDGLISHVSVEADTLLEPVSSPPDDNDARITVRINIRPYEMWGMARFFI